MRTNWMWRLNRDTHKKNDAKLSWEEGFGLSQCQADDDRLQ